MRINKPVTIGGLLGYFVLPPVLDSVMIVFFKQIPLVNKTPLETIEHSLIGLSFVIIMGLIAGTFDEITDEKIKHRKMMNEYKRLTKEKNGKNIIKQK